MRTIVALSLFLVVASPSFSQDTTSHIAAVDELFQVMGMERAFDQSVDVTVEVMIKSTPQLREYSTVLRDFISRYLGWGSLRNEIVELYSTTFTEEELKEITAFYRTPTGKKAVESLPLLMRKGAEIGQSRVQQHLPELQEAIKRYDRDHKK